MKPSPLSVLFAVAACAALCEQTRADVSPATFDLAAIRDASTLETRVVQDWKVSSQDKAVRQKVVEITVCEWWPGQKIRLPVVLNAPASETVCRNIIVANTGLNPRPALPAGAALRLLKEHGVGVVLVGMGTIEAMKPEGTINVGMRQQLLATKSARFTPAWFWGISDMRALTAAIAEKDVFQAAKVLATGGSKRGVAAAAAGIHDDRFTAIVPMLAPPLGSPGGAFVIGSDSPEIRQLNADFHARLAAGKIAGLSPDIRPALLEREERQRNERVTVEQARAAGWTEREIAELNREAWAMAHVALQLPELRRRGLAIFYNVGTNDNVTPALLELGKRIPDFPLYIVPGGQHGLKNAGLPRHVLTQPEVEENLYAFAQHHFFGARPLVANPRLQSQWNDLSRTLRVTVSFPDRTEPQQNALWWSVDRNAPGSLAFEYDAWHSTPLRASGAAIFTAEVTLPTAPSSIEFLTTHRHTRDGLSLSVSSPLRRLETARPSVEPPVARR